MSCKRIDLNRGWKLGWYPDPVANKWVIGFHNWEVKNGELVGSPTSLTRGLIYANCCPQKDYSAECRLRLSGDGADLRIVLCYSITRLSGYYLVVRPGQKLSVYYVYSDLFDHAVLDEIGPVCEAEHEYVLRAERCDDEITLQLDGENIGSFIAADPCGRYTALTVNAGEVHFQEFAVAEEDRIVFCDDFSENSLAENVPADFSELHSERWVDASVPGTVQTALLEAGVIEDPYIPFNGEKIHWMDNQRWIYRTSFTVPQEFRGKRLRLLFDGVDYLAHFWLNGIKLCSHEGMFGGPELDVTDLVDYDGENELTVCILPCPNPPHANVRPYILHRWHFNMDIITAGLWRGVSLIADDRILLSEPQVITRRVRPDGTAEVELAATLSTMALWPFDVRGRFVLRSSDPSEEPVVAEFAPGFCQGTLRVKCNAEIPNAKLWWPNGMGEQALYEVGVFADLYEYQKQPEPTAHDELHFKTGLRILKFVPLPPSDTDVPNDPAGTLNWCLSINGRRFFGKGSNWMPIDNLLRLDRAHYRRLLTRAVDSNINLLRPWGAGLLETDDFYELCDELGICVWQETLLANGIYDRSKPEVWRETMHRSVCRLRNHPSLLAYCGGNEFDPDVPENKDVVDEIAAICNELDPTREFRRACPYGGDNHSYLVNWMGGQPYPFFTRDLSVAITEFSQASPPSMESLQKLIPIQELEAFPPDLPDDIYRFDYTTWGRPVQRRESSFSILDAHLSGITNIMFPPLSDAGKPETMEQFVRYLQTAQGLLTKFGIDFWRSRWPRCTMTMSWVFNVIFPDSMSWSYVDYFGCPKDSYYDQKRAYERIHVGAVFDELFNAPGSPIRFKLFAVNETLQALNELCVQVRLYDTALHLLASEEKNVNLRADDVRHCGFFVYDVPSDMQEQVLFLCVDLKDAQGSLISRSCYCPRIGVSQGRMPYLENGPYISDVACARTSLCGTLEPHENGLLCRITNTGSLPAFRVTLRSGTMDCDLRYSDNCIWLESGETREIEIASFGELPDTLTLNAWNADDVVLGRKESI